MRQQSAVAWDHRRVFEEPRDALYLLQRWYLERCDDGWEHSYGVRIDTLDNPGGRFGSTLRTPRTRA